MISPLFNTSPSFCRLRSNEMRRGDATVLCSLTWSTICRVHNLLSVMHLKHFDGSESYLHCEVLTVHTFRFPKALY